MPESDNEECPKAELSEEEKKLLYFPSEINDLTPAMLARNFTKFTVPKKEEGFDEIRYAWAKAGDAEKHLAAWVLAQKQEQKVEDLRPSDWFKSKWQDWQKSLQEFRRKHGAFKSSKSKKRWEANKA